MMAVRSGEDFRTREFELDHDLGFADAVYSGSSSCVDIGLWCLVECLGADVALLL
jgi:hypothetical protein